jgi:RimJ/RimL family protein N-acetyltransferase
VPAPVPLSYPEPPLRQGPIALRPWQEGDLGVMVAICRDPDVARFTRVPDPYSEADARAWIDAQPGRLEAGEGLTLAITEGGGAPVGSMALRIDEGDREIAEAGYMVAAAARGRGVATTALRLASRWALRDVGIARVHLTTHLDNAASQRVAERAGFQREGVLRSWEELRGERVDLVIFSLVGADL